MLPALVRKTWRDERRAIAGWAIGLGAFTTIYTAFYSQFKGAAELKQEALPPEMLEFLGISDMMSPAGYLQATVFSLMGPLLVLMCAVTLTARSLAQAEEDGSMELLLTAPQSRTEFAGQRLLAQGVALTAVAAVPWIVLMVLVPMIGMDIPLSHVTAACAGLVALAWCFAGIAFLVGAATGRRAAVLAVTGALAVATYLASAVGGMIEGLDWLRYVSPFHYFIGVDPLGTGWHPAALAVLVVVAVTTTGAGVAVFERRDVSV